MFGKSVYLIQQKARDISSNPTLVDKYEVPVYVGDDVWNTEQWNVWEDVLDRWMPQFEEVGWLEELKYINIGDGMIYSGPEGSYYGAAQVICLRGKPTINWIDGDNIEEQCFVHEFAHHAHTRALVDKPIKDITPADIISAQKDLGDTKFKELMEEEVSEYAATDIMEAVAEMARGMMMGEEYPREVYKAYESLDGPIPPVGWRDPSKFVSAGMFASCSTDNRLSKDDIVIRDSSSTDSETGYTTVDRNTFT